MAVGDRLVILETSSRVVVSDRDRVLVPVSAVYPHRIMGPDERYDLRTWWGERVIIAGVRHQPSLSLSGFGL